jgi:hypothetical protein
MRISLFKHILQFLKIVFSFAKCYSFVIPEETKCHFLKVCYINFVKLYSHHSVSELKDISDKLQAGTVSGLEEKSCEKSVA